MAYDLRKGSCFAQLVLDKDKPKMEQLQHWWNYFSPHLEKEQKNMKRATLVAALCAAASASWCSVTYSVIDLGTLGGSTSYANGVNNLGQVTGNSMNGSGTSHAFVWSSGTGMVDIGGASSEFSTGSKINDAGQVVGNYHPSGGDSVGYVYTPGSGRLDLGFGGLPTDISEDGYAIGAAIKSGNSVYGGAFWGPGVTTPLFFDSSGAGVYGLGSYGYGLNPDGNVVGSTISPTGGNHNRATLWKADGAHLLGSDTATSLASGLNDSYMIAGFENDSTGIAQATIWNSAGLATYTGGLGGSSRFSAINEPGMAVGESKFSTGNTLHAIAWSGAEGLVDLNNVLDSSGSGWVLNGAVDVSNTGYIVGYGTHNGLTRGFLLTANPVPEPGTMVMLGLPLVAMIRRRKKA